MEKNISIIIVTENIRFFLIEEHPPEPTPTVTQSACETYDKWVVANNRAKGYA